MHYALDMQVSGSTLVCTESDNTNTTTAEDEPHCISENECAHSNNSIESFNLFVKKHLALSNNNDLQQLTDSLVTKVVL